MLRCYQKNNIDTTVGAKRIKAFEISDYPALKIHLKQQFPQYFGGLILDFSANIEKKYIQQCISDTFTFFEAANVAKNTRAALIGISTETYNRYLAKLGIIEFAKIRKSRPEAGVRVFEMFNQGKTVKDAMAHFGLKYPAVRLYWNVWQKKGISENLSEQRYVRIYNLWKNSQKEN